VVAALSGGQARIHSPHRCVNATFQGTNPAQNDLRARRKLVLPERRPQGQAQ
jgi:hypothetical protein